MANADCEDDLQAILAAYLEAEESGQPADRQALLARHPQWRAELESFFAGRDAVASALGELAAVNVDTPALRRPEQDISTVAHDAGATAAGTGKPVELAG